MRHLLHGGDPDAERVYRWHIEKRSGARMAAGLATDKWKRSVDEYVDAAQALVFSMAMHGFDPARFVHSMHPAEGIPIDPNRELLDGSHRVAAALALGIPEMQVKREPSYVWAPAWGYDWFVENGMNEADLARLRSDWDEMRG